MPTPLSTIANIKTIFNIPTPITLYDALINLYLTEVSAIIYDYLGVDDFALTFRTEIKSGNNQASITANQIPIAGYKTLGDLNSQSTTVLNLGSTANLFPYQSVIGPGLTNGTYIVSIPSLTSIILSQAPTLSQTQSSLAFGIAIWLDPNAFAGDSEGAYSNSNPSTLLQEGSDYFVDWKSGPGSISKSGVITRCNWYWPKFYAVVGNLITPFPGPPMGNIKLQYNSGYGPVPIPVQAAAELLLSKLRQSRMWGQAVQSLGAEDMSVSLAPSQVIGLMGPEITSLLAKYKDIPITPI